MTTVGNPRTINTIDDPDARCDCVADHNPNAVELHVHHLVPLGSPFDGPDEPDNEVLLCPTTHAKVHRLLRAAVRTSTRPAELPWSLRQPLGPAAVELAELGWAMWEGTLTEEGRLLWTGGSA